MDLDDFADSVQGWLEGHAEPRPADQGTAVVWGQGELDVAVFHNMTAEEEGDLIEGARSWQQLKATMGYHAIEWPAEYGGLGLSSEHERVFRDAEQRFLTPSAHEIISITALLIAPTINVHGTEQQRESLVSGLLRTDLLCCQLFSEPGAGSDLANLSCSAVHDGDEWVVNGQKVWTSGALHADLGELICRTRKDAGKHDGLTAFIVPMKTPGIEVRPIRQMSGGASFNEVFFTDVRIPDSSRLGQIGEGWKVALTTLGFERGSLMSAASDEVGGSWVQLLALSRSLGLTEDAIVRQRLATVYTNHRLRLFNRQRSVARRAAGQPIGPEGSIAKLQWTRGMTEMGEVVSSLLGPRIAADSGGWGTYVWNEHLLGAPGYRIAAGSDEIQRNIIAERVLGLPREPSPEVKASAKAQK